MTPRRPNYEPISIEATPVVESIPSTNDTKTLFAFWALGLLNNTPYVIMLAAAKSISEGGTALVFLANIIPSLAIKMSAPYWFDRVPYQVRIRAAAIIMGLAFALVALFSSSASSGVHRRSEYGQLAGVALISLQCGLGEATLLALAGKWDHGNHHPSKGGCLTAFSSGTGLAGPTGFLWKVLLNEWLGWTLQGTVLAAISMAVAYAAIYHVHLFHSDDNTNSSNDSQASSEESPLQESSSMSKEWKDNVPHEDSCISLEKEENFVRTRSKTPISEMTARQRLHLVLSLWPYTIPLFTVYAAEYACQSGVWTAIGFPMDDAAARNRFYEFSNWLYQAGVFLSRSSGTLFTIHIVWLWILPGLQVLNLLFFSWVAVQHGVFYQEPLLLVLSLYTGLLGGGVYVHGYKRIIADLGFYAEFALAAVSVAEGLGVLVADVMGLFLQSCLYRANSLQGAVVSCPL